MRIQVLPQTLINQIAAGEVVVRMASVVKELVENSIDAAARHIEVILENDCRDATVVDDGMGMNREDAELCLQRHATSKIRTVEDLAAIATRGFRGEAVPSICSVARVEIQTRPAQEISGTRIVVEGGRILRIESVGCPPGTRIVVRDLFFNTPARRKFLKSVVSETNAVLTLVTRQAMAVPHVGLRVVRDGRAVLELPPDQPLEDRVPSILGSQVRRPLLPLGFERGNVRITGLLAHPHDARGDRRSQFFFVNGRPFSSRQLSAALEQACRGFVMAGRFPICCVFVEVSPDDVDINVHPTKEEVRFRDERFVAGTVYHAAQDALNGSPALVGEVHLGEGVSGETQRDERPLEARRTEPGTAEAPRPAGTPPPEKASTAGPLPGFFTSPEQLIRRAFDRKEAQARQQDWVAQAGQQPPREASPPAGKPLSRALLSGSHAIAAGPGERPDHGFWQRAYEPEPLGQIANTYILVRFGEDLLIIDQHASHERLRYLELKRRPPGPQPSQSILVPIQIDLPPQQSEALRGLKADVEALGFELEPMGPRQWAVTALPADLPEFDPGPMLSEILNDFEEARRLNALDDLRDRILIRTACHSSIRAGMELPMAKMEELLRQIKAERLSFTCPHGRPTIVRLSKGELDRQFKRIV